MKRQRYKYKKRQRYGKKRETRYEMRSGEETAKADPSGSQGSQAPNQNDA